MRTPNHVNKIHGDLKIIRTVIHHAIAEELIPYEKNPFLKIKLKARKTSRSFLLYDELDNFEQVELEENSQISHHPNINKNALQVLTYKALLL